MAACSGGRFETSLEKSVMGFPMPRRLVAALYMEKGVRR
jgi:hypothetical protein